MNQRRPTVLMVQFSGLLDGSAMSGLSVAGALRAAGWTTRVAFGCEGPVIERYAAAGHEVRMTPHKSWLRSKSQRAMAKNVSRELWSAREIVRAASGSGWSLVYVNTGASLAGAIAARILRAPSVWHIRELFDDVGGELVVPERMRGSASATFRALATTLVTNSRAVAENTLGRAANRAVVIPSAVSDDFFRARSLGSAEARARFGLPVDAPVLGVPGTLRPMKGHPFLLSALPAVLAEVPDLCVAITGDGDPGFVRSLRDEAEKGGVSHRIRWLGTVAAMPELYRACDAVCVPSRAEPFGRTVIEAFAAGTPVIATDVGGIRETVQNDHTGLLVPYGDKGSLSRAILALLRDPALRARLRDTAAEVAGRHFRIEAHDRRIVEVAEATAKRPT
ncbi:MAG: glycosyltransferase family 4 protein [Deltaproteobacteria bacterium]|nr:glycosyltransferase family 4 protein [Deltaproteobacteria bacterium]